MALSVRAPPPAPRPPAAPSTRLTLTIVRRPQLPLALSSWATSATSFESDAGLPLFLSERAITGAFNEWAADAELDMSEFAFDLPVPRAKIHDELSKLYRDQLH